MLPLANPNLEAAQDLPPLSLLSHLPPRTFPPTAPAVEREVTLARDIRLAVVAVLQDTVAIRQTFAMQV